MVGDSSEFSIGRGRSHVWEDVKCLIWSCRTCGYKVRVRALFRGGAAVHIELGGGASASLGTRLGVVQVRYLVKVVYGLT